MSRARGVLWVSTSTQTRGGIASYVRTMQQTPLWSRWSAAHVATHADGSAALRVRRFALGLLTFWARLALRRPALVHVHTASDGSFVRKSLVVWSARARGVPVVLHVHGGGFGDFHDRLPAPARRYVRATLETAAVVIALGPVWAARLGGIAPAARIEVVPNAVTRCTADRHRGPRERVSMLFLGKVHDDKGTFVLVRAWARLVAQAGPPARLVVAGDGEVDRLRREVDELGLAESVDVLGWVDPSDVDALLHDADVLVLPSRWEGQPMAVLEAMAHGLAVVATDVGGIPDVVDDRSGLLVRPDDVDGLAAALAGVRDDADLRTRLGAGGLARVEAEFDTEVTWRTLDALYGEVTR